MYHYTDGQRYILTHNKTGIAHIAVYIENVPCGMTVNPYTQRLEQAYKPAFRDITGKAGNLFSDHAYTITES